MANIGKSIAIKGDLTGNEDIAVEGKVDGKVDLPNNQLTIGANGVVHAEIKAKSVVVKTIPAVSPSRSKRLQTPKPA